MADEICKLKPSAALAERREAVRQAAASHRGRNPRILGSALRGEDLEGSDLDLLIDPTAETTLFDLGAIRHEPSKLLGVEVDASTPKALPQRFRAQAPAEAASA
jgi:predicted nucleotidyltransferase